jgi:hypothetical protein
MSPFTSFITIDSPANMDNFINGKIVAWVLPEPVVPIINE